ncbi:MAG: glycosyltransferase family 4 protein [Anaerolineae bacterium]|nr:glycosyltransferase family 4 protein [Anaerolineae bacterium]
MRIGMITGEYPPMQGGVGDFTRELARALVQMGHQVLVLTSRQARGDPSDGVQVSAEVTNWNMATLRQVGKWARENQLNVVNIQYEAAAFQMAGLVHLMPLFLHGVRVITTFHDLLVPYLFPKAGPLRWEAISYLARSSDGVIVTNQADEQKLREAGKIRRLARIPIGSNIEDAPPANYDREAWRQGLQIPADAALVGYFGFVNVSKGVDTLLEGAAAAIQRGVDLYLLMIGGNVGSSDPTNAQQMEEAQQLIHKLGLESRIRWTGYVDNPLVSANLRACDLVVLPYSDGVSFRRGSFMAAITHGCAIITTEPEVELPELRDGENVRLIPRRDADQLASAVVQLAADPELRKRLGNNARQLAGSFSWDRIAEQTVGVYFG